MSVSERTHNFTDGAGSHVSAILAEPALRSDRAVLLCHGFLSNKNGSTNKALTRLLIEQGIAVYRFDFFGQGESQGPFEEITVTRTLDQTIKAVEVLKTCGYTRIGLIGSSYGGLVALLATERLSARSDAPAALALKCPVPDFSEMLRLELGPKRLEAWKRDGQIPDVRGGPTPTRLQFQFYEDCLAYDGYKAAQSVTVPTLIVQGDADELVPAHQSPRLLDSLRGRKRLDWLPGADHGFSKAEDFRMMVHSLGAWMTDHL